MVLYFTVFSLEFVSRRHIVSSCYQKNFFGSVAVVNIIKSTRPDTFANVKRKMKYIGHEAEEGRAVKIENFTGLTKVPVGFAGPLDIHGHHQDGSVAAPLATIELTLVACVIRGRKAFQRHGGVKAYTMSEGMGRAPVFILWMKPLSFARCFRILRISSAKRQRRRVDRRD